MHAHSHIHVHVHSYMYTHMHTYMYTLIHTCTYTQPEGENEGGLPLTSLKIVDMFKGMIRRTNKAKRTALHLAAENGHDRYILYYTVHPILHCTSYTALYILYYTVHPILHCTSYTALYIMHAQCTLQCIY